MAVDRDDVERWLGDLGADVTRWADAPGGRFARHAHDYDKILVTTRGDITFLLSTGGTIRLAPGDRLDLPAGTSHAAQVGPVGVECVEAHLAAGRLGAHPRLVAGWAPGGSAPVGPKAGRETTDGHGT